MTPDKPVHVSLMVGPRGIGYPARIVVNGVDLTRHCRGFKVDAGVSAMTDVWLDLIGVSVDIEADVPRDRVQQMTLEEAASHEEAQRTVDTGRGQKDYRQAAAKGTAVVVVGLGDKDAELR
jgi:hypothetical protein